MVRDFQPAISISSFSLPPSASQLVAAGADPLLTTRDGTTALMEAAGLGRYEAENLVTEARTLEAVKLAVEFGVDVNATNTDGRTALDAAKALRYDTVVKFLIEKGAK